jgi:hypothetical protein
VACAAQWEEALADARRSVELDGSWAKARRRAARVRSRLSRQDCA